LISGPPGIGKTSCVRIISTTLGYSIIEMNASDCRNKIAIQTNISAVSSNKSIKFFMKNDKEINKNI